MDFTWVSDIPNTRKHNLRLLNTDSINSKDNNENQSSHLQQFKSLSRSNSRLSYTPPSTTNTETIRRSRAGTMPSSTISPFMALNSSNLYLSQQRPNHNPIDPDGLHSGMSSPLDENTTNSIASTLASLGLGDDLNDKINNDNNNNSNSNNNNNNNNNNTNTSLTQQQQQQQQQQQHQKQQQQHYLQPVTRHRAFTFSSRNTMTDNQGAPDMMSFTPFPQKTSFSRPRAVSLGMADLSHDGFSPFNHYSSSEYHPTKSNSRIDEKSSLLYQPLFSYEGDNSMIEPISRQSSPNNIETQIPSRALWLGNISPSLSVPDLHKMFARYGHVESARILSDKECAFVNFDTVESAIAAKEDLVNRLGSKVGGTTVKVGFGKADVSLAMALTQDAGPNAQGPTRSLWVGNIPSNVNPAILRSIFQIFGTIESIRILSHKNCGFINFERQEDAVRARKHMQNKEILGPGTSTVRIGFAKAPSSNEIIQDVVISGNTVTSYPSTNKVISQQQEDNTSQWATVIFMASMMMNAAKDGSSISTNSSSTTTAASRLATERKLIMQQLGYESQSYEAERNPIHYFSAIPAVPEFSVDRKLSPLRLREIKKSLDNGQSIPIIESIAQECMEEIVELCSDYIGNTVVQKFFEYCSDKTKLEMLERIAPHLASIGIHKNGTWAAQKMIDSVLIDKQIELISLHIAPYVPLLLLDQFGNYVVQCCLRKGPKYNQYIFDAIVDKCWEIGQGRFGSRAVRSILENPIVTKDQQIYVAAAIMQNALFLSTNANGTILLNWLLDTSGLLGHFRALSNNSNN
ncbi:uncharacterized protein BX663DRAFT_511676 [Cokeromyces recurvatus]|uniref:uncharacterized protein n=1 Tax=Cokeromyces recurvatus TaxID=90255 RepID=UPI00221EDB33|nr:uncharacterized protein BX663DRAFT_511676 [Cokeromyces recurvatus]KAI7902078.1 hypothetical protein BX663DRAFT_511676 [Cokeromyces recurvatus]